jgi:archaemetzincin
MPRIQKVTPTQGELEFSSPGAGRGRIILGLIRPLPDAVLPALATHLQKEFGVQVESRELSLDVSLAFNRERNQYSSPKILAKLRKIVLGTGDKILGIVDVDLYCPDYDFIFGEADAAAGAATLSIYRLKQRTRDAKLIASRIIKEATHEIGHLFEIGHCDDPKCVMSFSTGNLWQIDAKSASVCRECRTTSRSLGRGTIQN